MAVHQELVLEARHRHAHLAVPNREVDLVALLYAFLQLDQRHFPGAGHMRLGHLAGRQKDQGAGGFLAEVPNQSKDIVLLDVGVAGGHIQGPAFGEQVFQKAADGVGIGLCAKGQVG